MVVRTTQQLLFLHSSWAFLPCSFCSFAGSTITAAKDPDIVGNGEKRLGLFGFAVLLVHEADVEGKAGQDGRATLVGQGNEGPQGFRGHRDPLERMEQMARMGQMDNQDAMGEMGGTAGTAGMETLAEMVETGLMEEKEDQVEMAPRVARADPALAALQVSVARLVSRVPKVFKGLKVLLALVLKSLTCAFIHVRKLGVAKQVAGGVPVMVVLRSTSTPNTLAVAMLVGIGSAITEFDFDVSGLFFHVSKSWYWKESSQDGKPCF